MRAVGGQEGFGISEGGTAGGTGAGAGETVFGGWQTAI